MDDEMAADRLKKKGGDGKFTHITEIWDFENNKEIKDIFKCSGMKPNSS